MNTVKHYFKWHIYYKYRVPKFYKKLGCPICLSNRIFGK